MARKWFAALSWLYADPVSRTQTPLATEIIAGKTVILDVINCWHWMYTTEFGLGTPPKYYKAIIDTAASDIMVPSVHCAESSYCMRHPLYNSSESSTYVHVANGTYVRVDSGFYYSRGYPSRDSIYIGSDLEIKEQTFEEADFLRPSYFFPESWHDSTLALSREIVYNDRDSNLSTRSPFQNMVKQGLLASNMFSLKLPRKVHETGFLLLGGRGNDYNSKQTVQIPLLDDDQRQQGDERFYQSGGWEVEPVYLHFGTPGGEDEIYYDLHGYAAVITTWPPSTMFPLTFTQWIFDHIGVRDSPSTMKCDEISAAWPNITVALRGVGGRVQKFALTYEDYALDQVRPPGLKDGDCEIALGGLDEDERKGGPKFIVLGPQFLRRHYTTFDEGGKSMFFSRL